jgi:hypothetical protein
MSSDKGILDQIKIKNKNCYNDSVTAIMVSVQEFILLFVLEFYILSYFRIFKLTKTDQIFNTPSNLNTHTQAINRALLLSLQTQESKVLN